MKKNTNNKVVSARKVYKCDLCNKKINIGDKYLRINVQFDNIYHFCKRCKENNSGGILQLINDSLDYEEYISEDEQIMHDIYLNEF